MQRIKLHENYILRSVAGKDRGGQKVPVFLLFEAARKDAQRLIQREGVPITGAEDRLVSI